MGQTCWRLNLKGDREEAGRGLSPTAPPERQICISTCWLREALVARTQNSQASVPSKRCAWGPRRPPRPCPISAGLLGQLLSVNQDSARGQPEAAMSPVRWVLGRCNHCIWSPAQWPAATLGGIIPRLPPPGPLGASPGPHHRTLLDPVDRARWTTQSCLLMTEWRTLANQLLVPPSFSSRWPALPAGARPALGAEGPAVSE